MITEDFVSFEIAKLLKDKGFKEKCNATYNLETGEFKTEKTYQIWTTRFGKYISAPTLQMAMKWLREVHNKIIIPGIRAEDPITGIIDYYYVGIHYIPKNNGGALCFTSPTPENGYSSYEEACEAGIKYCLENLI
jgi:hypothetical protein